MLYHIAPSSALLKPTVQTWMEGINELPSACASTRPSTALHSKHFRKDLSLEDKLSMYPNSLAEKGLGEILFSLSCEKLG